MNLSDLANIVEIIGLFAIASGVFSVLLQLRQHRVQRRDLAIFEISRSFEDKDFTEAYRLITSLPDGVTMSKLKELGPEHEAAAYRVIMKFEAAGLLVHRGVIPFDAMEDLVGGAALALWNVLETWVHEVRDSHSNAYFLEWYQWLVERLQERGRTTRQPAFEEARDWIGPKY